MFFNVKQKTTVSRLRRIFTFIIMFFMVISSLTYWQNTDSYVLAEATNKTNVIKPGTGQSGGGFTGAGINGEYFANSNLRGIPSFTRNDVRIDFDWGDKLLVGGSNTKSFKAFPRNNFSIRWTGKIIPRYSEEYTFRAYSDGVKIIVNGKTIADNWTSTAKEPAWTNAGKIVLTKGQTYDIKVEYQHITGNAAVRFVWSSPSIPEEVIEPLTQPGIIASPGGCFADIVKTARNSWGNGNTPIDENGWPKSDATYVMQESNCLGLYVDPMIQGTISFSFKGKADVRAEGNTDMKSVKYAYDEATNTTRGTFTCKPNNYNAAYFHIDNSHRDGKPDGSGGITDLKLMKPIAPNATTSYSEDTVFDPVIKSYLSHFTEFRVNLNNGNNEKEWSDRTLPSYFNQMGGKKSKWKAPWSAGETETNNGAAWEYDVMLCNEVGKDLYINIPMMATGRTAEDVNSYVYKLAQLIKYGSDGVNPYTSPQKNPVYPPLNPNLKVYIELSNEHWNWGFSQYFQLDEMLNADKTANNEDYKIITYDGTTNSTIMDRRKAALRIVQISNIFRSIFGDSQMLTRVRPIYEYQYNNYNGSAEIPLSFIDKYFNNADGQNHVAEPHPVNYYLWGGGGATYFGAQNPNGLTDILQDSSFVSG